jgi:hypothetical protein
MSISLNNGYITYGDGSTQSTKSDVTPPWTNVSGRPTDLGSFTNGPGYHNGTLTWNCVSSFLIGSNCGGNANCANCYPNSGGITTYTSGYSVGASLVFGNCNYARCNCNCNC